MSTPQSGEPVHANPVLGTLQRLTGRIGTLTGHAAALMMAVLAASVTTGIILRNMAIDNTWTFDVDLFTLTWVAFVGASFTAFRGHHVTSGIALENTWPRSRNVMLFVRLIVIVGFLVLFTISGYELFIDAVHSHEATLDTMNWPMWPALLAVPVGTALWIVAEIHRFITGLAKREDR